MITPTEMLILLFTTGIIVLWTRYLLRRGFANAIASLVLIRRDRLFQSLAILLVIGVFVCTSSRPVLAVPHLAALGAEDRALTKEDKALDENLRLNPEKTQYTGLESVDFPQQPSGKQLSDAEIRNTILSNVRKDLDVSVTNGSVLLNGRVEDKETAQDVVEQIKQIPSVREITFSLGLEDSADKKVVAN